MSTLALTAPQYACSATACVGWVGGTSGGPDAGTTALFKALQKQINEVAGLLQTKKVAVDGKIGKDTVDGYMGIRRWLESKGTQNLLLPVQDYRHLSNLAGVVLGNLQAYMNYFKGVAPPPSSPPVAFPPVGGGGAGTEVVTTPAGPQGPLPASAQAKIFFEKNKLYILGGLGIVAVGAYALLGEKKKDEPSSGKPSGDVSGPWGRRSRGWR